MNLKVCHSSSENAPHGARCPQRISAGSALARPIAALVSSRRPRRARRWPSVDVRSGTQPPQDTATQSAERTAQSEWRRRKPPVRAPDGDREIARARQRARRNGTCQTSRRAGFVPTERPLVRAPANQRRSVDGCQCKARLAIGSRAAKRARDATATQTHRSRRSPPGPRTSRQRFAVPVTDQMDGEERVVGSVRHGHQEARTDQSAAPRAGATHPHRRRFELLLGMHDLGHTPGREQDAQPWSRPESTAAHTMSAVGRAPSPTPTTATMKPIEPHSRMRP